MDTDITELAMRLNEYAGAIAIEADKMNHKYRDLIVMEDVDGEDGILVSRFQGDLKLFRLGNGDLKKLGDKVEFYLDSVSNELEAIREGVAK